MSVKTLSGPSDNLVKTYVALGRQAPTSRLMEEEGFLACTGDVDHAICNFAMKLSLTPDSAERLREIARGRPVFNVYCMPSDPPDTQDVLREHGFKKTYTLVQMESREKTPAEAAELIPAVQPEDRRHVAGFMVDQFFGPQVQRVKYAVTSATAAAVRLQLFGVYRSKELIGAVMAHRSAGCLGLYNLCVVHGLQGRGYGASIVRAIQDRASDFGIPVTLQCDRKLEGWYERLGFRAVGTIGVYALPKKGNDAIMN